MAVTFSDYLNELKNKNIRKPKIRVEFLRYEDETIKETITGYVINSGGSLSIENKNGQRRSISFSLQNISGNFTPNPDGIWIRQKIRVWAGLDINGQEFLFNQGVFVMEDPTAISSKSDKTLSITASDKFSLADGSIGGETDGLYIVPVGTSIMDAIQDLLQPSTDAKREIFYDPIPPIIDNVFNSEITPYSIEISQGGNIGDILLQLADMVSANVFYNTDGQLVFEQDVDDNIKGSQFDFEEGDFNYTGTSQKFLNSKVYNAVSVVGANINGDIATGYVENNDLSSDTSIPNLGFKRVLSINDPNISTDSLALQRAVYELKRVTRLQSSHSITSVPMYHLDADVIVRLTDTNLKLIKKRNLINSLSLPLSTTGEMSIDCGESIELLLGGI